jgi:hypothetical protein
MENPEIKTSWEREVKEHEVFLAFTDDDDAGNFLDWWRSEGSYLFNCWVDGVSP